MMKTRISARYESAPYRLLISFKGGGEKKKKKQQIYNRKIKHHLDRIIKIKITNAKYMDTCLYLQM